MSNRKRSLLGGFVCVAALVFVTVPRGGAQDDGDASAKLETLLRQRRDTLRQLLNLAETQFRNSETTQDIVIHASNRLLEAELELLTAKAERMRAHEKLVENMRNLEQIAAARRRLGTGSGEDVLIAMSARLKAEIELLRASMKED